MFSCQIKSNHNGDNGDNGGGGGGIAVGMTSYRVVKEREIL